MHYVWQHRLFPTAGLQTVDGQRIAVINPGVHNTDAGPDFFNATVKIDDRIWVGNVEIHVRASDWKRHGHDGDKAYDSVILHVVDIDDMPVKRPDGQVIPQLRLPCSSNLNSEYHTLTDSAPSALPCAAKLSEIDPIYHTDWIASLGFERLHAKADRALQLLDNLHGDWEGVAFITLARAMGFGVNNEPFERLARSIGPKIMQKCSHSLATAEALLLGRAGFLDQFRPGDDSYGSALKEEYLFLCRKFDLPAPPQLAWKMSRMRPGNSPQRRLATLAHILTRESSIMSRITEVDEVEKARELFIGDLTGFWADHYSLTGIPCTSSAGMSVSSANILIINALAPLLHAYGTLTGQSALEDRAVRFLEDLKPEDNKITKMFDACGIKCRDAFTSQALIQLRREYCEKRKCLYCRIGHRLLSARALRPAK